MDPRLSWPDGARLAMSFVVNVEEGSEMSVAEGDKAPEPVDELSVALKIPIRNYGNESNYQYGIRAGGPRVLDMLKRHRIRCTFTAAALSLERAPDLTREIVAQGHEVCSHGWRWVHTFSYEEDRERAFVAKAVDSIARTTGTRPHGWLSRYLHTPNTRRLLVEQGFRYHMDDYSDDVPRWEAVDTPEGPRPIVVVPYALDTNDMKFWLSPSLTPDQWLDYAIATFDTLYDEGAHAPKMMSLGLHLRIIGRPGRIGVLDRFMSYVCGRPDVWITTRLAIADRFAELCPWEG